MRLYLIIFLSSVFLLPFWGQSEESMELWDDLFIEIEQEGALEQDIFSPDFTLELQGEHNIAMSFPLPPGDLSFEGEKVPQVFNQMGILGEHDAVSFSSLWNVHIQGDDSITVEWDENYLSWNMEKVAIAIGLQYVSWGTADGLNPTDTVNPRKTTDVEFGEEKKPILVTCIEYFPIDEISLQFLFVPYSKRGNDETQTILEGYFSQRGLSPNISLSDEELDLMSTEGGLKLNFYTRVMDVSFHYFLKNDPFYTPDIKMTLEGGHYIPSRISLEQKRLHQIGGDLRTSLFNTGLWFETALFYNEESFQFNDSSRNPEWQWITGMDFNYGPDNRFTSSIQFFGRHIIGFDRSYNDDYPMGVFNTSELGNLDYMEDYYYRTLVNQLGNHNEEHLLGLIINLEWPNDRATFTPKFQALYQIPFGYRESTEYDQRLGEFVLDPHLIWNLQDSLSLEMGVRIYGALNQVDGGLQYDETGILGSNAENNRVYLHLKYSWNVDIEN